MKKLTLIFYFLTILLSCQVSAASDGDNLIGEWHGQIRTDQGSTVFIFKFEAAESGDLTGMINLAGVSGDGLTAEEIMLDDGDLTFKFNANKSAYHGRLEENQITGELKTGGVSFTLNMEKGKYTNPYALDISREAMELLSGEWHGILKYTDGPMLYIFRFGKNGIGEFTGFADRPYFSNFNVPIAGLVMDGSKLELAVPDLVMTFKGTVSGDKVSGTLKAAHPYPVGTPVTLEKGHYEIPDYSCNLPVDAVNKLMGTWKGYIDPPGMRMDNNFHVALRADGKVYCFYDNPTQGFYGSIMINKSWEDGRMVFETIFPSDAKLNARLSGNRISGNWQRPAFTIPARYDKTE